MPDAQNQRLLEALLDSWDRNDMQNMARDLSHAERMERAGC